MNTMRDMELKAADGTPLYVRECLPSGPSRGGILIMHGLGEHCGRYGRLAKFLNQLGWSVRAYDHRGHGRSGGPRGDVPDELAIVRDAEFVLDDFADHIGSPPLLLGHSMGGLFAARVSTGGNVPLRGLILSSPVLALPLTTMQKVLLAVLSRIAPGLGVPNGVDSSALSHDVHVGRAYDQDPLVHDKISARLLQSMQAAVAFSQAHAANLSIPVLLQVAGDDRLVDASGSKAFHAALPAGHAQLCWYDGLYHEIYNEAEADAARVMADLQTWMTQHGWAGATRAA